MAHELVILMQSLTYQESINKAVQNTGEKKNHQQTKQCIRYWSERPPRNDEIEKP